MSRGSRMGEDIGDGVKKPFAAFHGAGESIRGNFNTLVDSLTGTDTADSKNHEIAARGSAEIQTGTFQTHNKGVTPSDTERETATDSTVTGHPTFSNVGSHHPTTTTTGSTGTTTTSTSTSTTGKVPLSERSMRH